MVGSNGNWWTWDLTTSAYVDTGVVSVGVPDIEISDDVTTGYITMTFSDGIVSFTEDTSGDIIITY
jgi:hypothetical protein